MSFISERSIKSVRKPHWCEGCDKPIAIGEAAVNWCGINDGEFNSAYYHPDCRAAEIGYNRDLLDSYGDEWSRLCDAEPESRAWIKAHFPVPYRRMLMTRAQYVATLPGGDPFAVRAA